MDPLTIVGGAALLYGAMAGGKKVVKAAKGKKTLPAVDWAGIAGRYGLDAGLLKGIAWAESSGNPSAVNSTLNRDKTKDIGLMQINSSMLKRLGISETSAMDATQSVETAAYILHSIKEELGISGPMDNYKIDSLIAAYNMGAPRFRKFGIRPEVATYISRVRKYWGKDSV